MAEKGQGLMQGSGIPTRHEEVTIGAGATALPANTVGVRVNVVTAPASVKLSMSGPSGGADVEIEYFFETAGPHVELGFYTSCKLGSVGALNPAAKLVALVVV